MKAYSFKSFAAKFSAVLISVLVLVGLTGCPDPESTEVIKYAYVMPVTSDDGVIEIWTSSYGETYTITTSLFSADAYAGDNLYIYYTDDEETAGYIYMKYTSVYDWTCGQSEEPEDTTGWYNAYGYWYPTNTDLIGKWYAVSFKNLTSSSVDISGAYGTKSSCDTLNEAVQTFTVANGYYTSYSTCTKSE